MTEDAEMMGHTGTMGEGDMGMMGMMGPTIYGFHLEVVLMIAAGIFYAICAYIVWKPLREGEKELISALTAFLIYQTFAMIFMGLGMQYMNMLLERLGSLAVFVGSVYMLKFPFSVLSEKARRTSFLLTMLAVLVIFTYFVTSPER